MVVIVFAVKYINHQKTINNMEANISKLVYYHANPEYHQGYEVENILVASCLLQGSYSTYEDYKALCAGFNAGKYNENVFNDHKEGIKYVYN